MIYSVIIIGAGVAGLTALEKLMQYGLADQVALVSSEDRLPYKRTKVSKHLSKGFSTDEFALHDIDFYQDAGVSLFLHNSAIAIKPESNQVVMEDGSVLNYQYLILATGVIPNSIGPDKGFTIYQAQEAAQLSKSMGSAENALIIGGGILGIEAAEQMKSADIQATLVTRDRVLMRRELHPRVSRVMYELLVQNGVDIIHALPNRVRKLDSEQLMVDVLSYPSVEQELGPFDLVVEAIGSRPNIGLAQQAGLAVSSGILVDSYLRTSDPNIFAIGDCAETHSGYRTHLWHAAEAQGMFVADQIKNRQHDLQKERIENQVTPPPGQFMDFTPGLYRTKCEVFGSYFFSAGLVHREDTGVVIESNIPKQPISGGRVNQRLWYLVFDSQGLLGLNMAGPSDNRDKERSKVLQQAVRDGFSRIKMQKLCKELS